MNHRHRHTALRATILLLAGLVPAGGSAALADEPRAPASPRAIVEYHDSGEWARDTTRVIARARRALDRRLSAGRDRRPAIVLDVDDTSLSSYSCLKARDFKRSADSPCARAGDMPAIPQTLDLHRHARARGAAVFFITGRRERLRRATVANLAAEGFTGLRQLVMRPNRERPGTHDGFKARERRRIQRRGFRIVLNVGDQRSDLAGGAALRAYKLPNPMYVIRSA